jgi:hypothetical protein
MINRYLRIFPGVHDFGHKISSGPRRGHFRDLPPAEFGTKIIILHAPDLQGATFTGCRNTGENFPMLPASTTFCACSGVTCSVTALATVATDG